MTQQYSQQFKYALYMLAKIEKDPPLAEQLAQSIAFQDFLGELRMHEEDIKNNKDSAG